MQRNKFTRVSPMELYNPPKGIIIRAGLIPVVRSNDRYYYLMGIYPDNVLTDMGGGCKTSRGEKPIDCLLREIKEETDDRTADTIIDYLRSAKYPIEVWRQTGKTFKDLGYNFAQRRPGPVHRYYVLLVIPDKNLELGGLTDKEEVNEYRWFSRQELTKLSREDFSLSINDFMEIYLS